MGKSNEIPQEMLDRYISGQASLDEIALVTYAMKEDEDFREIVKLLEELHKDGVINGSIDNLPMGSSAAVSENNLCDVICEQFILRDYLGEKAKDDYQEEFVENCWLKASGTPLYNIGRLLEKNGMTVTRQYGCSFKELGDYLQKRYKVIAVVDYGQLWHKESDGIFHAVVCLNIVDKIIRVFEPAANVCANYPIEEFVKAWQYSNNYLVCASNESLEYIPHPIDVQNVELDDELMELTEAIAENAHEVWAKKRRDEGWKYGSQRNDADKLHPDMVPYCELPEGEKYYDRDMALNTIRLVKKLGFNISRRYTAYCSQCGEFVSTKMHFCPNCGHQLSWEEYNDV